METVGGIIAAGLVLILALTLAAALRPHTWLQVIVLTWSMPPAFVGFGFGAEFVEKMTERPLRPSSWKWAEAGHERQSRNSGF
jgi:hypothetical protein